MAEGLLESITRQVASWGHQVSGVAIGTVKSNEDSTGLGRVQVTLPWLPGMDDVWATVAAPSAGKQRGAYFIPQVGDAVLLAFEHGDVRSCFVLGSVWNEVDPPPARGVRDPVSKRMIHTPQGHELLFDDDAQSITIKTNTGQKITMDSQQIEVKVSGDAATITLDTAGKISMQSNSSIEMKAPRIILDGQMVEVKSSASTKINGGGLCNIQAGLVQIN